ncbi:hypothetical protein AMTRI_Chr11g150830 [Amborella trichopoda]
MTTKTTRSGIFRQPSSTITAVNGFSQLPIFTKSHGNGFLRTPVFGPTANSSKIRKPSRRIPRVLCRVDKSFLNMKPGPCRDLIDMSLHWGDGSSQMKTDVVILGAGPAGLSLAEKVSASGVRVVCIDPSPLAVWPNNYGVWVDEFSPLGLEDCLDHVWPLASVLLDDQKVKYLDRPYARVSRNALKRRLLEGCVTNGVNFLRAKAWRVEHQEFSSLVNCDDGSAIKGSLVVDATGFKTPFMEYPKNRNHGYQIAHGILAEVEGHPFDLDKMVLMDWRDSHMGNEPYLREGNRRLPTFLYAMPLGPNLIFLEETSLVSRPILSYLEIKKRMVARLRHLGIVVKEVLEDEKCVIPMGGRLPIIPQNVVGMGGNAGLVHPSTGYTVARSLAVAPILADSIVDCLGSTRMIRGRQLHSRIWNALWPLDQRMVREYFSFGMETLLKLDLEGTRRFFDAFFDLDPYHWHGFLSSRLSLSELAMLSLNLFGNASNPSRLDIVTKCPWPLCKMLRNIALEMV